MGLGAQAPGARGVARMTSLSPAAANGQAKARLVAILVAGICVWLAGCTAVNTMDKITQLSYTSDAGSILPELQWHERIVITASDVSLARTGRVVDTQINAGTWVIPVDRLRIAALFRQLEAVDCARIRRIAPADPPDGGGTVTYTVTYGRGRECSLVYDPGATYANGELLVQPIESFIRGLALPADAAPRYRIGSP
jgi:hypothetical protein